MSRTGGASECCARVLCACIGAGASCCRRSLPPFLLRRDSYMEGTPIVNVCLSLSDRGGCVNGE